MSCLAVRAYKHLGNAKCQDIASICKPLFGFFGFGVSMFFVLKEVHQVLSVCVNASALDEFEFVDPGGSRCSVPSAQCHAE